MPTRPDVLAHDAASAAAHHPMEMLGRIGYGVKGVLYALLGVLALQAAFGSSDPEGSTGALAEIAGTSLGNLLLWVLTVGLLAYGLWRLALAVLDPEDEGTDGKGLTKRAFYVLSGLIYGSLAYTAYQIVTGSGGGGEGGTQERTATVLSQPLGHWLVGIAAIGIAAYGLRQFWRAYQASFMDKFDLRGIGAEHRDLIRRSSQAGLAARGIVYLIVGGFLGQAALQSDASEARGLDGALQTLQQQPFGPYLLGAVAIGLIGYAVYCWTNARYRRFEGNQ